MVVYLENQIQNNFDEFNNALVEKKINENFKSQAIVDVEEKFSLFIDQGEFGIVSPNDRVNIVGSDDATTCHIIILKSAFGHVCVCHFDGNKSESDIINNILSDLINLDSEYKSQKADINTFSNMIDAYVLGGFYSENLKKETKLSENLSQNYFGTFSESKYKINVKLWFTLKFNTQVVSNKDVPIFNGLAINMTKLTVFPATFQHRGPQYILRAASRWVTSNRLPLKIYDSRTKNIEISPFNNHWEIETFKLYSRLPDELVLKYFSSSPTAEPPQFTQRLRKCFILLSSSSVETLFPNSMSKLYGLNDNGQWTLL